MQVILKTDVDKLGRQGDIVIVAEGYARNYLIPHKKAIVATERSRKAVDHEKKVELDRSVKHKKDAEKLAADLANVSCTIRVKAGENDQLFGSVTTGDIAGILEEQGYTVDRKKIILEEPIRELGVFTVPIKVYQDVTANIKVWVVKE
jgi:large subunit ribosomal protein L9